MTDLGAMMKHLLVDEKRSMKSVLDEYNARHGDKQFSTSGYYNKVAKGTIRFNEVEELLDILGYEIEIKRPNREGGASE